MAYPVAPSDPTAIFGRRVLAALLDAALLLIPFVMLLTSAFEYIKEENLPQRDGQAFCDQLMDQDTACIDFTDVDGRVYYADDLGNGAWLVLWGGSFLIYVLVQAFTGWTPGKLATGIRTVREDGRRPGFVKAFLRWLLWVVDGFPYFIPGLLGFIVGLTTVGHRRVGDMAAKTFVVRKSAVGSSIVVPGVTAAAAAMGAPWDVAPPAPGTPTGWPAPQDPAAAGWASPAPPPAAPAPAPVPTDAPQWDAARGTYIQWDPDQRAWMQWDDVSKAWSPIPGQ
ncbi:MAG: RDD family protein [Acidimicrobiales bacterium]